MTAPGTGRDRPRTPRGQARREAVLDAAAALFLEHGFHGTSVDEVGAAAGISGPGLYRHFPSKDALLMALLDEVWRQLRPHLEAAAKRRPREALDGLVDAHIALVLDQPAALVLLVRELKHLPADYRASAHRNHLRYVDAWVESLRALAPDLDGDAAHATVLAVQGLIDSAARSPEALDAERRRALLRELAAAALDRALATRV